MSSPGSDSRRRLVFDAVVPPVSSAEPAPAPFHLALRDGDVVVVRVAGRRQASTFVDLALGLATPAAGEVRFLGTPWHLRDPLQASAARRLMGWISPRPQWLSNLDLDENVRLVARYYHTAAESDLDARMHALMRRFGLTQTPRLRAPFADEGTRLRSGWVRALLPRPRMVLIDAGSASSRARPGVLAKALAEDPDDPRIVLWIATAEEIDAVTAVLNPTRLCTWLSEGVSGHE